MKLWLLLIVATLRVAKLRSTLGSCLFTEISLQEQNIFDHFNVHCATSMKALKKKIDKKVFNVIN